MKNVLAKLIIKPSLISRVNKKQISKLNQTNSKTKQSEYYIKTNKTLQQ